MTELKPCPFCGGKADYFADRIFCMNNAFLQGIKCKKCGGAYFDADKRKCPNDMVNGWNKRKPIVILDKEG